MTMLLDPEPEPDAARRLFAAPGVRLTLGCSRIATPPRLAHRNGGGCGSVHDSVDAALTALGGGRV